ncbi:MAG: biotin/lipoyl-containing protein [Gaiella sp.]
MPVELALPAPASTTEHATAPRWLEREGEDVAAREVVLKVEGDTATCELDASVDGLPAQLERAVLPSWSGWSTPCIT